MALHVTNSHGYVRNGKFDGLLGDLHNGLVEVGGTCMLFAGFRMMAITFLGFNMPMRCVDCQLPNGAGCGLRRRVTAQTCPPLLCPGR